MSKNLFVRDEKTYLANESKDFISRYPQASNFLASFSTDPDINRTLDGLTYLTGLLNAKLEQEHQHLALSLMSMLWPNNLQSVPSIVMMELSNVSHASKLVAKGSYVHSKSIVTREKNDARCTFQLTRDTWVSPFKVNSITKTLLRNIEIEFRAESALYLASGELNGLRLYCGLDQYGGYLIYLWLVNYLHQAILCVNDEEYLLPDLQFVSPVFTDRQAILVYPGNAFSGYRLLHEYFCYPEGFLFLDIKGIPEYFTNIKVDNFSLRLVFNHDLPSSLKIDNNLIKTNCCPAINLFAYDFEPICLDGKKTEYPVVIDYKNGHDYELFAIKDVVSRVNNQVRHYSLFDNFHHEIERAKGRVALYYSINRKQGSSSDKIHYSLSFMRSDEVNYCNQDEIISVSGLCSNNSAQNLRLGSLCYPGDEIPCGIKLSNLSYPSKVIRPKLDNAKHWATISLLSLSYLSLLNEDSLKQVLQNHELMSNYSDRSAKKLAKLLSGITKFSTVWHRSPYRGLSIEGRKSCVEVVAHAFDNDGQMYLFGEVLAHFYSQCANVNSFHFLELINATTKEVYQWHLMNS